MARASLKPHKITAVEITRWTIGCKRKFEEGCRREVMDETRVSCEVKIVLDFWHCHGLTFEKLYFYYVCLFKINGGTDIQIDHI